MSEFLGWVGLTNEVSEADISAIVNRAGVILPKFGSQLTVSHGKMAHAALVWNCGVAFNVLDSERFVIGSYPRDAIESCDLPASAALLQSGAPDPSELIPAPFAFALGHQSGKAVDLFSDLMATQPLYYCFPTKGQLLFATDLRLLVCCPDFQPELSLQSIYDFVHFHVIPGSRTIYDNVHKLPPASRLRFRNGEITIDRYWPTPDHAQHSSKRDLKRRLFTVMSDAVRRQLTDHQPVACFLSGGLDSSTIAGMASRFGETHAFSIGFSQDGYDEIPYATIAARHFELRHHVYYVTPNDVVETLPIVAGQFGEPFGNLSAIPVYQCASLANEAGFSTILAGDGGDELFAGNERYIRQQLFGYYRSLPMAVRRALEPMCARLLKSPVPLVFKIGKYVTIAKHDLPTRLLDEFEYFLGFAPERIFEQRFLQHIDKENPLHFLAAIVRHAPNSDLLEQLLWVDWQVTLTDNDLRKVHYMCKAASIQPVFPMLDREVVELARSVPPRWKMTARELRRFYKQAFTGFLPDAIIAKKKHGFGLPFGEWLRDDPALKEMVHGSLRSLERRGIFRKQFIDECSHLHRTVHASYYGSFIGALVLLELWLQNNDCRLHL